MKNNYWLLILTFCSQNFVLYMFIDDRCCLVVIGIFCQPKWYSCLCRGLPKFIWPLPFGLRIVKWDNQHSFFFFNGTVYMPRNCIYARSGPIPVTLITLHETRINFDIRGSMISSLICVNKWCLTCPEVTSQSMILGIVTSPLRGSANDCCNQMTARVHIMTLFTQLRVWETVVKDTMLHSVSISKM